MLREWDCLVCQRRILAFEDDVANNNSATFEELRKGLSVAGEHVCSFVRQCHSPSLLHGEAGFLCEGTVLDSTNTIHDFESANIQKAEDERELKGFLEAMKNS